MQFVAEETSIELNGMKAFEVEGTRVLVVRTDEGVYATQAKCTHLGAPLEKGKLLDNCRVQCPFHRAEFDIKSGEVCEWANFPPGIQMLNFVRGKKDLKTYPTKVEEGKIYVDLSD